MTELFFSEVSHFIWLTDWSIDYKLSSVYSLKKADIGEIGRFNSPKDSSGARV